MSHVIPDFYLKRFAAGGKLFVYAREVPVRTVAVKPNGRVKECRERDYFEYPVDSTWSENKVENWLASIEHKAGLVFPSILNNRLLTPEEAQDWAVFVASLFLRTRKVRLQLGPLALRRMIPEGDEGFVRNYQHDLLKKGHLIPYRTLKDAVVKVRNEMVENPAFGHLISISYSTPNIARLLLKKAWTVCEANEGSFFCTSDAPVVTMKIGENREAHLGHGFGKPNVAALLPISPTKIFIAGPHELLWKRVLDSNTTALLNKAIMNFADRFVYSHKSSEGTQLLVDSELGLTRFGQNAFK